MMIPDCRPCSEVCAPGYYCPGILSGLPTGCTSCETLLSLPANAEWVGFDCSWACSPGFYYEQDLGLCLQCPMDQACFQNYQRFMGCRGASQGQCINVTVEACREGSTFLYYEVYFEEALCSPCSAPTPNVTYLTQECTLYSDAQLKNCTAHCPPGYFMVQACNKTANIQCSPCTPPQVGRLMLSPCSGLKDAVFDACPPDKYCDGGLQAQYCPFPQLAKNGLCVCPPAMVMMGGCQPMQCRQGWYPDPKINNCTSCGDDRMLTIPGVMGIAACACPLGYFIQQEGTTISCWPCGDLVCTEGLQEQTDCPGTSTLQPTCQCIVPHGALLLDSNRCTFRCDDAFDPNPGAILTPGIWPQPFVSREPVPSHFTPFRGTTTTSIAVVGPSAVVTVEDAKNLYIHYDNNQSILSSMVDNRLFIQGDRLSMVFMTVCRDRIENRFWVGFVFETEYCAYTELMQPGNCSTVELVQLSPCSGAGLCPSLILNWGKDMQAGFLEGGQILLMAMDYSLQNDVLYMLLSSRQLYAYPIYYYTLGATKILDDPMHNITGPLPLPTALAAVGGNLYLPGFTLGPSANLFTAPQGAQWLSAVGDHVLLVDKNLQVDIGNGFQASTSWQLEWVWGYGAWAAASNKSHLAFSFPSSNPAVAVCPLDSMPSSAGGVCQPMPCLRLRDACGNASIRMLGSTVCACVPGYYKEASPVRCVQCPENHYCDGLTAAPASCTPNSQSAPGSWDASQCLCRRGYYSFGDGCLSCPAGYWCYGMHVLPIQCMELSTSLYSSGSTSPLDCQCLDRTHGITCQPCLDSEYCNLLPSYNQPTWVALEVMGWGALAAPALLQTQCLSPLHSVVYSLPGPTELVDGLYPWGWIIVTEVYLDYAENISDCLQTQAKFRFLSNISIYTSPRTALGVRDHQPCPMNWEWSATNALGLDCICIPGYSTIQFQGYLVCVPCMNGTMRAKGSPDQCVPCEDNHSYAPWMAMSHCICLEGYYLDPAEGVCLPIGNGFYMYNTLSSPLIMISLSLSLGLVCLLGSIIISFLFL